MLLADFASAQAVALAAVKARGEALRYVAPQLLADPELVLHAARTEPAAKEALGETAGDFGGNPEGGWYKEVFPVFLGEP